MQMGDTYAYVHRLDENNQPVRFLAILLRVDDPGFGLDVPQLLCYVIPPPDDAVYSFAAPFPQATGLYPFGTNQPNSFEPISASE